jgi:hypothetical protein
MSLNDLANLGQIIGAVAVVISLFYVASQIRQNTNAVRAATRSDIRACRCKANGDGDFVGAWFFCG